MANLLSVFFLLQAVQGAAPDLDTVIRRATEYVTKYEAELGNLIGTEDYEQVASWIPPVRFGNKDSVPRRTSVRRTSSDFMIIQLGDEWVSLREVNSVDGAKVVAVQPPLETAFDASPAANTKRFKSMKADSTKYNIGGILREDNLPTFAIQILRQNQVSRFSFQRDGTDKIDGATVWRLKFREMKGSALVTTKTGKNLYATGNLWIDPVTGQILKTEFRIDNPFAQIVSTITVTYAHHPTRKILVPSLMDEHYLQGQNNTIHCHAVYLNFHPFTVDVKFEVTAPKPLP